jgi:predicted permease
MSWLRFFRREKWDDERSRELQTYLDSETTDNIARGMSPNDARDAARRKLGNITQIREEIHHMNSLGFLETFWQDLRYGLRLLARTPAFSTVAVLSLALGIGASTAIFSVANEVLFKTLPVRNPEQLVLLRWSSGPKLMGGGFRPGVAIDPVTGATSGRSFSYLTFQQFTGQTKTLSDVFAFTGLFSADGQDGRPGHLSGQFVSGNYFSALGVPASLGRLIVPDDDREAADSVVVISHRYWERRFGLDPTAIGRTIQLGNTLFTIIGVSAPDFLGTQQLGDAADLSIPLAATARLGNSGPKFLSNMQKQPWIWAVMVMGRRKPEVTFDQVRADLQTSFSSSALEGWTASPRFKSPKDQPDTPRLQVVAGNQGLMESREALSRTVKIMIGIVGIVLLIVCVNLANLLLARATVRRKEIGVRFALGGSRARLIRQLLTENVALTVFGALGGILFAYWGKDLSLAWIHRVTPSFAVQPRIDLRVLGFTAAVTILTGILVGLAPALRATRMDLNSAVKDSGLAPRGSRSLTGKALLVAQVAMSFVLLILAGLFTRTIFNLERADVGFNMQNLLLFDVDPQLNRHPRAEVQARYSQAMERIQSVSGVQVATASGLPLLSGDIAMPFIWIPGHVRQTDEDSTIYLQYVWPNFFEAMGMHLMLGRNLTPQDTQRWLATRSGSRPYAAVVNEALAHKYFPGVNPIGQRFCDMKSPTSPGCAENDLAEIVGVVRDAKFTSVRQEIPPTIFYPFSPAPVTFEVRTSMDPMRVAPLIREAVNQLDGDLLLSDFRTQSAQAEITFARERHFAWLSSLFGVLALILACIGLYGLLTYSVVNRTKEFGVRMALGAQRGDVLQLVMRESLVLVLLGIVAGFAAAIAATRLIASMLYGIAPNDPWTIFLAAVLMLTVSSLAGFLPARKATRVDPMVALRYE